MEESVSFERDTYLQTKYTSYLVVKGLTITILTEVDNIYTITNYRDFINSGSTYEIYSIHPLPKGKLISVSYEFDAPNISIGQCFVDAAISFSNIADNQPRAIFGSGYLSSSQPLILKIGSPNVPQLTKLWYRTGQNTPNPGQEIIIPSLPFGIHKLVTVAGTITTDATAINRFLYFILKDIGGNNVYVRRNLTAITASSSSAFNMSIGIPDQLYGVSEVSMQLPDVFIPQNGDAIITYINLQAGDQINLTRFILASDMGQN